LGYKISRATGKEISMRIADLVEAVLHSNGHAHTPPKLKDAFKAGQEVGTATPVLVWSDPCHPGTFLAMSGRKSELTWYVEDDS
jgi:hypothetical protein